MARIRSDTWTKFVSSAVVALVVLSVASAPRVWADDALDARQLVDKARLTFESFQSDSQMGPGLRDIVRKAKGVMIYPQVLRGAFFVGGAGGNGVFLAQAKNGNAWGGPAFYAMGQVSFGLQIGGDASEVVVVALTERGVNALLSPSAKLGGNVSIAAGPVGAGAAAATENLSADLVSYTRNKGLYVGVSLEGAVVTTRGDWNQAYYGRPVTTTDILVERKVSNPQAAELVAAVARVAGGSEAAPGPSAKAE
jgi:lipid-binding SYLF domain-containing protein